MKAIGRSTRIKHILNSLVTETHSRGNPASYSTGNCRPIIWWLNIILEFATCLEDASFVIGTQYHVGPRSEEVMGQMMEKEEPN